MAQNGAYLTLPDPQTGQPTLYCAKPRDYVVAIAHDGTASSTAIGTIQIDPSSPFLLTQRNAFDTKDPSTAAPGLMGAYPFLVQIQDQSNGYLWQNDFVPRSCFAKSPERGGDMSREVLVSANSRLIVTVQNPAASADTGTAYVVLSGFSLYEA